MDSIYQKTQEQMAKSIESLKKDLNSVSTGRATTKLLDAVRVDNHGNLVPLTQIATVSVSDSSTITIQTWDKTMINAIERAITIANLGFTPKIDGGVIRVSIPKLTEERRKDLTKVVKKYGEDKKISIRNHRREALEEVKKTKDSFAENDIKKFSEKIQLLTDKFSEEIEDLLNNKEKDILKI